MVTFLDAALGMEALFSVYLFLYSCISLYIENSSAPLSLFIEYRVKDDIGDFPDGLVRLQAPSAEGPGLISSQETRSHMLQLISSTAK